MKNINLSIFIPIRKGSKRIKNKNIKPLPNYNLGLTELKILQIKKLQKLLKNMSEINKLETVVSTDCPKIKKYIKNFNWIRLINRDSSSAQDDSLSKLIKHASKVCNQDYILWTHVTSPNFCESDYIEFVKKFLKLKKKTNSQSGFSADTIQKFLLNNKGKWISHNIKKKKWPRTQDLKPIYVINSAAFISSRNVYIKYNDRLCKKPIPIKSKINSGFDIDTSEDFEKLKNEIGN